MPPRDDEIPQRVQDRTSPSSVSRRLSRGECPPHGKRKQRLSAAGRAEPLCECLLRDRTAPLRPRLSRSSQTRRCSYTVWHRLGGILCAMSKSRQPCRNSLAPASPSCHHDTAESMTICARRTSLTVDLRIRFAVDDAALSRLHADAFGGDRTPTSWKARLEQHSRSWVGAFVHDRLVGFVHAIWDGGSDRRGGRELTPQSDLTRRVMRRPRGSRCRTRRGPTDRRCAGARPESAGRGSDYEARPRGAGVGSGPASTSRP